MTTNMTAQTKNDGAPKKGLTTRTAVGTLLTMNDAATRRLANTLKHFRNGETIKELSIESGLSAAAIRKIVTKHGDDLTALTGKAWIVEASAYARGSRGRAAFGRSGEARGVYFPAAIRPVK